MKNVIKLLVHTRLNNYAINLEKDKQSSFGPIYSLKPVKLETLKTYIKTNLANGFIWPFKFPTNALILFDQKPNKSLHLCMDYWGFNNITIKNKYPLPLIGKSLNQQGWTKKFTQLDLINAYYWMIIHEGNK